MTQPSVLFLVPQSHERWFVGFFMVFYILTPFQVCSHVHLTEWKHMLTHTRVGSFLSTPNKCPSWRIRRITSKPKPLPVMNKSSSAAMCDWSAFQCLSAALQCFQVRLQLANASSVSSQSTDWSLDNSNVSPVSWRKRSGWNQPRCLKVNLLLSAAFGQQS